MTTDRRAALRDRLMRISEEGRRAIAGALAGDSAAGGTLSAYLVLESGAEPPDEQRLRDHLAECLPAYMVPRRFAVIDALPRTRAGKLDRRALATMPGNALGACVRAAVGPRTAVEETLAGIWKEVLRVDEVGIDDDFFEVGGDSLLSIRVISRARRAGLIIPVDRFFDRPTIAGMAEAIASAGSGIANAELPDAREPSTGAAPLTPIQLWFLDVVGEHRDHWNQAVMLAPDRALGIEILEDVVRQLVSHHDALRLRLERRDGSWVQRFGSVGEPIAFRRVELGSTDPPKRLERVEEECEREQRSMRIDHGPLFRVVAFESSDGWRRLLLLAHHLVVDAMSWEVLLEDLALLIDGRTPGHRAELPARTAGARAWAIALSRAASRPDIAAAAGYWLALPAPSVVPREFTTGDSRNLAGDAERIVVALDASTSEAALAVGLAEGSMQALLLAALASAWRRWTGQSRLVLDIEGHGRDAVGDLDVSRTVGWFTTVFPIAIECGPTGAQTLRTARAALAGVPHRGASHGVLRWYSPDRAVRAALAARPRSEVLFNYLGDRRDPSAFGPALRVSEEPTGTARDPAGPRAYVLELNAYVMAGRLTIAIEYSCRIHHAETIERFAGSLRDEVAAAASRPAAPYSLAPLDAAELSIVADLLAEADDE